MAISRYNRYPVSGMTNVQIYTGTVSIQYRNTTTYWYTAHPQIRDTKNLTFFTDVHEGVLWLALRPNADSQAANHGIYMRGCVWAHHYHGFMVTYEPILHVTFGVANPLQSFRCYTEIDYGAQCTVVCFPLLNRHYCSVAVSPFVDRQNGCCLHLAYALARHCCESQSSCVWSRMNVPLLIDRPLAQKVTASYPRCVSSCIRYRHCLPPLSL